MTNLRCRCEPPVDSLRLGARDTVLWAVLWQTSRKEPEPRGEHACFVPRPPDPFPPNLNHQVESSAVSFRTLALLSVAAVFGAILTQPSALGHRSRVDNAPLLRGTTPRYEIATSRGRSPRNKAFGAPH